MKGLPLNIEELTNTNENFRKVIFTSKNSQLVVMCLKPGEDIGTEVHQIDQFLKVESGTGKTILDGVEHHIEAGYSVSVPAGVEHNIMNTSDTEFMKLYTVYSPPNHLDGTIHKTKADAIADEGEHFDGKTTEL